MLDLFGIPHCGVPQASCYQVSPAKQVFPERKVPLGPKQITQYNALEANPNEGMANLTIIGGVFFGFKAYQPS